MSASVFDRRWPGRRLVWCVAPPVDKLRVTLGWIRRHRIGSVILSLPTEARAKDAAGACLA